MVSGSVKGVAVRRFDSCPDYKIINVMKQLIKQSIIGALYLFATASMGAVIIVALYTMVGR